MSIPVVPVVPNTTVVNKEIVYSNTRLPFKDIDKNLKVNSIIFVKEDEIEDCLKTIFESNPNVTFNTIQYSKIDEMIYLYTDKYISTKVWEQVWINKSLKPLKPLKPLKNIKEILEEITELLSKEEPKTADCIALYDVVKLINDVKNKLNNIQKTYYNCFTNKLNRRIIIKNFDYEKKQLNIDLYFGNKFYSIPFTKQDGDLCVVESETKDFHQLHYHELLYNIGKELSELYDELMKFNDFDQQQVWGIKPLNSNFLVDINHWCVVIHDDPITLFNDFELSFEVDYNKYKYRCNSTSVATALQGKEDELFKKIFVKIDDCPEWSRQKLYQIRQKQLEEEKRLEDEQLKMKAKQQREPKQKRKLFSWLKK